MSNTLENQPQSPAVSSTTAAADDGPPPEIRRLLNDVFFAPIRAVVEAADITRQCHSLEDHTFAILCVMRALRNSKTGRDFLQTHAIPQLPELSGFEAVDFFPQKC
jgi:hypothetical protein